MGSSTKYWFNGAPVPGIASNISEGSFKYWFNGLPSQVQFTPSGAMRPDGTTIQGGWVNEAGGAALWSSIDEVTADDSDYIRSMDNPVSDICQVSLTNVSGTISQPFYVGYRYGKAGAGKLGTSLGLIVSLKQGSTLIASWSHSDIPAAQTTTKQGLTSGQFAAISDFTDLRLEFEASNAFIIQRDGTPVTARDTTQVMDRRP